jgi:DnaJ like chaperone protein
MRGTPVMVTSMSIWTRIADALSALASGEGLTSILDRLRASPAPERSVGFTIAVIALGAKMAKADGVVTRDEVTAFRRVFAIPEGEEANAARVFNLARQDVAGFDAYARKVAALFRPEGEALCADDRNVLIDLLEGLFHIAMADGSYHPAEQEFLAEVARIFGLDDRCFRTLRARFVEGAPRDPYDVLGISADADFETARAAWKQAVRDSHPDAMIARGVPVEAIKLAERRLIAINEAWETISSRRVA